MYKDLSTGCSIIYYCILKARQKSSLSPFQSPDSSFDSHRHQILLAKKITEKERIFEILEPKYWKFAPFAQPPNIVNFQKVPKTFQIA